MPHEPDFAEDASDFYEALYEERQVYEKLIWAVLEAACAPNRTEKLDKAVKALARNITGE